MNTINFRKTCPSCKGQLAMETIAGMVTVCREVNGRKVYSARCSPCGEHYELDGGKAPKHY